MCFYDCIRYTCECWKWGNLRSQCNKEYRIGEACGLKLCNENIWERKPCRTCEKLFTKMRRRDDLTQKLVLWEKEGRLKQLRATAEKYSDDVVKLNDEIDRLLGDRDQRRLRLGRG
jgi:hypothetical protein